MISESPSLLLDTDVDAETAESVADIEAALARLRSLRKSTIEVEGVLLRSKLAWKVATFYQPMRYRVVMLAEGCILTWNYDHLLCSYLSARALIETVALVIDFDARICLLTDKGDIEGIDQLLQNRIFSTRDKDPIREFPGIESVNVLTLIDKLDAKLLTGIKSCYDRLSERCHPNGFGAHQFFSTTDRNSFVATYRTNKDQRLDLQAILSGLIMVTMFETCVNRQDVVMDRVASAHEAYIQSANAMGSERGEGST